jgi:hypothetical protein
MAVFQESGNASVRYVDSNSNRSLGAYIGWNLRGLNSGGLVRIILERILMATTTDFNIYADFNQFVVCSEGADWSELSEKWSPTAIEEMIVCGAYTVVDLVKGLPSPCRSP